MVVDGHGCHPALYFGVKAKETQNSFPTLYWFPTLHKNPYKAKFIANSSSYTTTELLNCKPRALSPYLTGLRLFCDSWRQTSRVGRKSVSKQSPVIRNFLACVAKWRKVVAKILNMFNNSMRQNSSQNSRNVIADVSNPSRTCRRPLAI